MEWLKTVQATFLVMTVVFVRDAAGQDDYSGRLKPCASNGVLCEEIGGRRYGFCICTSGPIKCYSCFGDAKNSSCSDPIYPRTEKSRNLEEIECDRGICLKWTYYYNNELFMHRTCSERHDFRIMMIDGVCRSERNGNGYLCMCGKHLCNTGPRHTLHSVDMLVTSVFVLMCIVVQKCMVDRAPW